MKSMGSNLKRSFMLSPVLAGVLLFLMLISEGIARTPYFPDGFIENYRIK